MQIKLSFLILCTLGSLDQDSLVDRVEPSGTVHYSLADAYTTGLYSTVFKGVYIDEHGRSVDAVVKYGLALYDASCAGEYAEIFPCPSIREEISALRSLSSSPHVVRLLGTISDSSLTRVLGNFHVVLPGLVLERLSHSVQRHVASGNFWLRISTGFDSVARQLQCLHVQIFETVLDMIGNFNLYNADPSLANVLLTGDVWRDERRPYLCAKVKMIDYGFVAKAETSDAKLAGLALTCTKLDDLANSVKHVPGLALAAEEEDAGYEPVATIRNFAGNFFQHDATYRVGPDSIAAHEISEFVRKFPPSNPSHALAVCGGLVHWAESWCGTLAAALRSRLTISV